MSAILLTAAFALSAYAVRSACMAAIIWTMFNQRPPKKVFEKHALICVLFAPSAIVCAFISGLMF